MNTRRISSAATRRKPRPKATTDARNSTPRDHNQSADDHDIPTKEQLTALDNRLLEKFRSLGLTEASNNGVVLTVPTDPNLKHLSYALFLAHNRVLSTLVHNYNATPAQDDPGAGPVSTFWELRDHILAIANILVKKRSDVAFFLAAIGTRMDDQLRAALQTLAQLWIPPLCTAAEMFALSSHLAPKPMSGAKEWKTFLDETTCALGKLKRDRWRYFLPQKELAELLYGNSSQEYVTRIRRALGQGAKPGSAKKRARRT